VLDLGQVADDLAVIRERLAQAAEHADLVLTSGGVSVGEADYVRSAVASLGEIDTWRVFLKPGKPLVFGRIADTPFIGLPGNPVSTFATFYLFVRPALLHLCGASNPVPVPLRLPAGFDVHRPGDRPEYIRVRRVTGPDGGVMLEAFANQNSGIISSLTWADGLALLPSGERVQVGTLLDYFSFSELFS